MPDDLSSFMSLPTSSYLKVLLGGETGDGKTTTALTFPGIHYYGLDTNFANAQRFFANKNQVYGSWKPFTPDIISFSVPEKDQTALENFKRINREFAEAIKNTDIKTFVFDSLTRWSDLNTQALQLKHAANKDGYAVWKDLQAEFISLMNLALSLPANFFLIGHWELVKDAEGFSRFYPYMNGKSQFTVASYFPETWAMSVEEDTRDRKLKFWSTSRFKQLKASVPQEELVLPKNPHEIYPKIKEVFGL